MKRSPTLFGIGILLTWLSITCLGQDFRAFTPTEKPNGKVKTITSQRTYFVDKGKRVNPQTVILSTDYYSEDGKLTQTDVFGNGEERTIFSWTGNIYTTSVRYFDSKGNPAPDLSKVFTRPTGDIPQTGLCAEYTTRKENDASANIELEKEICKDNSVRRSTISEMTSSHQVLRIAVEDARGRSWEFRNNYGVNFLFLGFKYTVNDLARPQYWQEVTCSNEQRDDKKNIISRTCSSTDSHHPGQIRYEYIEENKIVYYDN